MRMSVCLRKYLQNHTFECHKSFGACYAIMAQSSSGRIVIICVSGFADDVMFAHNGQEWGWRHEKAYTPGTAQMSHCGIQWNQLIRGQQQIGMKSDVYNFLDLKHVNKFMRQIYDSNPLYDCVNIWPFRTWIHRTFSMYVTRTIRLLKNCNLNTQFCLNSKTTASIRVHY